VPLIDIAIYRRPSQGLASQARGGRLPWQSEEKNITRNSDRDSRRRSHRETYFGEQPRICSSKSGREGKMCRLHGLVAAPLGRPHGGLVEIEFLRPVLEVFSGAQGIWSLVGGPTLIDKGGLRGNGRFGGWHESGPTEFLQSGTGWCPLLTG